MRGILPLLSFLVSILLGAPSRAAAPALGGLFFDVNDVSILFPPMSATDRPDHFLGLNFQTLNGILFSEDDLKSLLTFAGIKPGDVPLETMEYKFWKLIGVRVDPFAEQIPGVSPQKVELRLVFQPFVARPKIAMQDHALHLIYELPESERASIINAFGSLKVRGSGTPTFGVALGIHPAIRAQGLMGSFVNGLAAIISRYAGRKRLRDATAVIAIGALEWRFVKASQINGELRQQEIPFSAQSIMTMISSNLTGQTSVSPPSSANDNVNGIVDSIGRFATDGVQGNFFSLAEEIQTQAIAAALRIDNPLLHGPSSTDCLSCHQATRSLARVLGFDFLQKKDGNPNRYRSPEGLTATLQVSPFSFSTYSHRAFGYTPGDSAPEITQGVINSSLEVADRMNRQTSLAQP